MTVSSWQPQGACMANASHRDFGDLIDRQWSAGKHLCIGLDTDVSKVPPSLRPADDLAVRMLAFNEKIVDATGDVACAYKPNSAYYEALGSAGVFVLEKTIEYINDHAPGVPVIVDGKREFPLRSNGRRRGHGAAIFRPRVTSADSGPKRQGYLCSGSDVKSGRGRIPRSYRGWRPALYASCASGCTDLELQWQLRAGDRCDLPGRAAASPGPRPS